MTPGQLRDRCTRFAIDVARLCQTFPRDPCTQEIATQLHAAAQSVASNYRAVCRAQSPKMFFAKLCIVVEEIDEAQGWLERLIASGQHDSADARRLHQEATELVKIFAASKRTWLRNHTE